MLREISDELLDGGSSTMNPDSMRQLSQLTDSYRHRELQSPSSATSALAQEARLQLDGLAGQLRAAVDLAAYSTPSGRQVFERGQSQNPWKFRVAGSVAILRANLSLQSAAFRHALRLAACVGIGEWVARTLSWQRSYWLPMTVAIILKPDFTATLSRGVLRLAGTAAGLLLATALFHVLALTPVMEVVILAGIAFVLRCYGPANYGIFVTGVSALVVSAVRANGSVSGRCSCLAIRQYGLGRHPRDRNVRNLADVGAQAGAGDTRAIARCL